MEALYKVLITSIDKATPAAFVRTTLDKLLSNAYLADHSWGSVHDTKTDKLEVSTVEPIFRRWLTNFTLNILAETHKQWNVKARDVLGRIARKFSVGFC